MSRIPAGPNPPNELYVIVEIPKGSKVKYELKFELSILCVDRILFTAMAYPYNYGIIPCTLMPDGEPLDALIITNEELLPGSLVKVRPIGILEMEDEKGVDHKLITVPSSEIDPTNENINDVGDLSVATLNQIRHFFEHYKDLEPGKWSKVRRFLGIDEAKKMIIEAITRFKEHHNK